MIRLLWINKTLRLIHVNRLEQLSMKKSTSDAKFSERPIFGDSNIKYQSYSSCSNHWTECFQIIQTFFLLITSSNQLGFEIGTVPSWLNLIVKTQYLLRIFISSVIGTRVQISNMCIVPIFFLTQTHSNPDVSASAKFLGSLTLCFDASKTYLVFGLWMPTFPLVYIVCVLTAADGSSWWRSSSYWWPWSTSRITWTSTWTGTGVRSVEEVETEIPET